MSLQLQVLDFEPRQALDLSPYRTFTRKEWSELRNGVQLTLSDEDLARLSGLIERNALVMTYSDCFWLMGVLILAMTPVVLLLRRPPASSAALSAGH